MNNYRVVLTGTLALLISACQSPGPGAGTAGGQPPVQVGAPAAVQQYADVDATRIVDCQLPGRMIKVGRNLFRPGPRRLVQAAARICEIRGGAYVVFDRADFDTALRVWKGAAAKGDARAQLKVGEIYELGLGRSPDHREAARWYQRAADQGSSAALKKLGRLYEQGLGVAQDKIKALELYRRSVDLGADVLIWASSAEQLRAENTRLKKDRQQLASRREQVQKELRLAKRRERDLEQKLEDRLRQVGAGNARAEVDIKTPVVIDDTTDQAHEALIEQHDKVEGLLEDASALDGLLRVTAL